MQEVRILILYLSIKPSRLRIKKERRVTQKEEMQTYCLQIDGLVVIMVG